MTVDHGGRRYDFPLADLEAVDESTPQFRILDDYSVWYEENWR